MGNGRWFQAYRTLVDSLPDLCFLLYKPSPSNFSFTPFHYLWISFTFFLFIISTLISPRGLQKPPTLHSLLLSTIIHSPYSSQSNLSKMQIWSCYHCALTSPHSYSPSCTTFRLVLCFSTPLPFPIPESCRVPSSLSVCNTFHFAYSCLQMDVRCYFLVEGFLEPLHSKPTLI